MADEPEKLILQNIDRQELVDLAVTMGNIYSPTGREGEMIRFVENWMNDHEFNPRLIGPMPERSNVMGRLGGSGGGLTLAFNSHMDVTLGKDERHRLKQPDQPVYYQSWIEGDFIFGNGVVNDKGPMAAWMIACEALRKSGLERKGDILLCSVVGEIGHEPVDEFEGIDYIGKDFSTQFLLNHGGSADLAIVAEATNFQAGWVEAGKAFFKVVIEAGPSKYTPYVEHGEDGDAGNAIVAAAKFINSFEQWAKEYEENNRTEYRGGTVVPKAGIGAIRGGLPYLIIRPPEVCSLFIDVRLTPGMNPLDVKEDLTRLLRQTGLEGRIELYLHRPGYEAQEVDNLLSGLKKAHGYMMDDDMVHPPEPPITSMWRDLNVYAQFGIPAVTYGPGGGTGGGINSLRIPDLMKAAQIYALAAYYLTLLPRG